MTDTTNLDTTEKVDILIKQSLGFPSTSENKQWYEETTVKFNNYLNGEELFLDVIPNNPDFDINGKVRTPDEVGLVSTDFMNYNANKNNKSICSIVDDSTGTVRRYRLLILEQTPQLGDDAGASWYKLNSSSNNVIKNAFQFNFKQYKDEDGNVVQPYLYGLYTQKSTSSVLPFGRTGGNWIYEIKNGIIFFTDFNNFSNGTQTDVKFQVNITDNLPVLTFYTYIGRKGINLLNTKLNDISNTVSQIIEGIDSSINEYFDFEDALTIKKDVYISQNLYVDGSFTYINSSVQTIVDPIIELGSDSCGNLLSINDRQDRGLKLTYYDDSYNIQKSGFIGLINQESSNLYNQFALYSDASFNNNIVDLSESSLGLLNVYGLNSEIINTNSLYNNNDLSLDEINIIDNSDNLVLNLKQLNYLINNKSFLTQKLFNNFIDNSYNFDLSFINNNFDLINLDISTNKQLIDQNILDISTNKYLIDQNILDISNISKIIIDISNRDINLNQNVIDISNINSEIINLNFNNLLLKSDINYNSTLINDNKYEINLLKNNINQNVSDISINRHLIHQNVSDISINRHLIHQNVSDISSNRHLIHQNVSDISSNRHLIHQNVSDISSNRHLIHQNVSDISINRQEITSLKQDILDISINIDDIEIFNSLKNNIIEINNSNMLLKSDIFYNNSIINNNNIKIDFLETTLNMFIDNFNKLEKKLYNAFEFL
jgi:hypothetical protein